jgi:hypothetical protein
MSAILVVAFGAAALGALAGREPRADNERLR